MSALVALASACSDGQPAVQQAAATSGSGGSGGAGSASASVSSTATTVGAGPAGLAACSSYCTRLEELCGATPDCAEECEQELLGPCASSVVAYAECMGEASTVCGAVPGACYDEVVGLGACARDQCVVQGCAYTDAPTMCQCQISCDANAYLDICEEDASGSRCSCYLNGFPLGTCESSDPACGDAPTNCCDQYLAGPGAP